jgi:hypothetical protein
MCQAYSDGSVAAVTGRAKPLLGCWSVAALVQAAVLLCPFHGRGPRKDCLLPYPPSRLRMARVDGVPPVLFGVCASCVGRLGWPAGLVVLWAVVWC